MTKEEYQNLKVGDIVQLTKEEYQNLKVGDIVQYGSDLVGYVVRDTIGAWPFRVMILGETYGLKPAIDSTNYSYWIKLT